MLKRTNALLARVLGGGGPSWMNDVGVGRDHETDEGKWLGDTAAHGREGVLRYGPARPGQVLQNLIPNEEGYHEKPLTNLPGVRFPSDLPADPITRLFFQAKGDYSLYRGTYEKPAKSDIDRVEMKRRDQYNTRKRPMYSVAYDFCHRLREGQDQRKRLVLVPATHTTKGCAQVLYNHGLIAGFRDFGNDRAFAVELKYFQNEPTMQVIEPASRDRRIEFLWSPKMLRRLRSGYGGVSNHIRVFIIRTHDGRILDHLDAVKENVGGFGLLMAF